MNEEINHLLGYNDMKIIQRRDMFTFSLDTVLLANFCAITKDMKTIVDFGTNNAAIPLILTQRTHKKIIGVEIQTCWYCRTFNFFTCLSFYPVEE